MSSVSIRTLSVNESIAEALRAWPTNTIVSIVKTSKRTVENMRRAERNAFNVVRTALIELADHPLHDEVGLARARQRCANAKDNWASALRTLDAMAVQT